MIRTLCLFTTLAIASVSVTRSVCAQTELQSGIDTTNFSDTVTAGADFYEYINEGWLKKHPLPGDESNYGVFTMLNDQTQEAVRTMIQEAAEATDRPDGSDAQKVGDFYTSYIDIETRNKRGAKPLAPLLKQIEQADTKAKLAVLMAQLSRQGISQPVGYYVSPDARDSANYTVYFSQHGTTLPDRDYYLEDDTMYVRVREAFPDYIVKLLTAVGYPDPEAAAPQIVALETKLAEAQWTKVANRDPIKTYNKVSSGDLAKTLKHLQFEKFAEVTDVDRIENYVVRQPSFLEAVNQLFDQESLQVWQAYMAFHVADSLAPVLSADIEKIHFDFHDTVISGVGEQQPMWKRGVEATGGTLSELVGKLYVDRHFTPQAKQRMTELVENLKAAFAKRIDQLEWMTPPTKLQAHEKLSKFRTKIGYPDQWKDYSKLEIKPDELFENVMRAAEVEHAREVDKLGGPIDPHEWHMSPQTINAYYNPVMNEIVFPAAILQPPFFNLEADDAANYGGIGSVIGHELSHGFDDKGSKYDGEGNLRNWWNESDRSEFEKRSEGLVEQFGQYKPFPDMSVNGELTLGENIGDLGGLNVAYTAYQMSLEGKPAPVIDGLTGDQRLFIGWAQVWPRHYREPELRRRLVVDPHSPSRYRVNGIVSNMDAFYKAFDIKPGDKMFIPADRRVKIW
ncbi:Neutral endopeptidase [Rosistilla carotiformis]|uniref:Neutral endopeptidase n=1 Tax=Rosistilla carotiformis TaxID=2528017 RepID=A0A518JPN0_9BACT|nr:M13 family metallopeptidase [Rosistilla carotiformis]QDV67500.1 Neutral endopeptidase [Rosistilla carotiformis]